MPEPLDLAPIKARLEAATPGPWRRISPGGGSNDEIVSEVATVQPLDWERVTAGEQDPAGIVGYYSGYAINEETDADLIAHAPTDLAALIAEVERLRGWQVEIVNKVSPYADRLEPKQR